MKLLGTVVVTAYYVLFLLANAASALIVSVAMDGCSKCYIDSNAERWNLAAVAFFWLIPVALFLIKAIIRIWHCRARRPEQVIPRITFTVGILSIYAHFMAETVSNALSCGSGCLPPHPLSGALHTWAGILLAGGLIISIPSLSEVLKKKRQARFHPQGDGADAV